MGKREFTIEDIEADVLIAAELVDTARPCSLCWIGASASPKSFGSQKRLIASKLSSPPITQRMGGDRPPLETAPLRHRPRIAHRGSGQGARHDVDQDSYSAARAQGLSAHRSAP